MRTVMLGVLVAAALVRNVSPVLGQQNVQYDAIPNPYLLLLREPAVLDDLKLTGKQKDTMRALNARIDGPFLALRNMPNDEADKQFARLIDETQRGVGGILTRDQQQRIKQILLRVRGIECLQDDKVAEGLQLSTKQRDAIHEIVKESQASIAALRQQAQSGKSREPLDKEFTKLRTDEQKKILAELTPKQKEQFTALLGRGFDLAKIGKVAFQAPELVAGGEWVNSKPLRLEELRGHVVALHFWTFG